GSGHTVQFVVAIEAASIEGNVKYYEQISDDGNTVSSGFCDNCGSPILKKTSGYPQYIMFHAATLDDPSSYEPQMVVYSQFKQPWDHVDPSLPRR
ncbi:MAG: GFA family protein, partial [Halobacteria archaeon]|nr:GFA family protein [Halobacteria archaeon]